MHEEFTSLTLEQALAYCRGSEGQRVRSYVRNLVGEGRALDVGCGNGIDAQLYQPRNYVGVDVSPVLVEAARVLRPDYQFFVVDGSSIPWPTASFDDVVIKSVLEHCASLEEAIAMAREGLRVAKGRLFIAWHTPPTWGQTVEAIVRGHFGKLVHQSTWPAEAFEFLRPRSHTTIDNFMLWTIYKEG